MKLAGRSSELSETDLTSLVGQKNSDRMRKQLLDSVIAKYRGLSVSRSSVYLMTDLLATDGDIVCSTWLNNFIIFILMAFILIILLKK